MCLGAIYWARPKKIYFAATREDAEQANFDDSFIYKEVSLPINQRKIPTVQLMKVESKAVFTEWNALNLRIDY